LAILEDRGIFWWNDKIVPKTHFAPDSFVGGNLTIEDDGTIRLELDAIMPSEDHPFTALLDNGQPVGRNIQGLLTDAGNVLLLNAIRNGGTFSTNNIAKERYFVQQCLVSQERFKRDGKAPLSYRSMKVELTGFEDWLWLQSISVERRHNRLIAKYKAPKDRRFDLPFGVLSIEHDLSGPYFGTSRRKNVNLVESAAVKVRSKRRISLKEIQDHHRNLEELIILLTASNYNLDWPTLYPWGSKQSAKLYFPRFRSEDSPPGAHECLVNFPRIAESFGELFAAFAEKREQYGPGIYLYLGTHRGMKMFVEHRFVNLIWGLEAFDRRGRGQVQAGTALDKKVRRIIAQVSAAKDRGWLEGKLKNAGEPSLSQRLLAIFSALPLPFDHSELKKFCEECQARRNDISHFGGLRHQGQPYDEFMQDLDRKSNALSALYHLHLLTIIGVEKERLDFAKNNNRPLWRMERDLRAVGLLMSKQDPQ